MDEKMTKVVFMGVHKTGVRPIPILLRQVQQSGADEFTAVDTISPDE
jgi:hypothetical protein